jgi:hypothetical protein
VEVDVVVESLDIDGRPRVAFPDQRVERGRDEQPSAIVQVMQPPDAHAVRGGGYDRAQVDDAECKRAGERVDERIATRHVQIEQRAAGSPIAADPAPDASQRGVPATAQYSRRSSMRRATGRGRRAAVAN